MKDMFKYIGNKDFEGFLESFKKEDLVTYKDNDTGRNVLHLIAEHGDINFLEKVVEHYFPNKGEYFNSLLLEQDHNNNYPADNKNATRKERSKVAKALGDNNALLKDMTMTDDEIRRNDMYVFLKRETKNLFYGVGNSTEGKNLYQRGLPFKDGIPLSETSIIDGTGVLLRPSYGTIRLINYRNKDDYTPNFGLNPDDNHDARLTNFMERVYVSQSGKKQAKYNQGEVINIHNLVMDTGPLSISIAKTLPFPEDWANLFPTLDIVGESLRRDFGDSVYSPILKKFMEEGGVISIENQSKPFFNGNLKENLAYSGLNSSRSGYSVISLNSKAINKNSTTILHEKVHSADKDFSRGDFLKYVLSLQAGRKNPDHNVIEKMKHIMSSYGSSEIGRESIAYIFPLDKEKRESDPLTNELCSVFSAYVNARLTKDYSLLVKIEKLALSFPSSLNQELKELSNKFNQHLKKMDNSKESDSLKITDYTNNEEKAKIENELIPSFLEAMKSINPKLKIENEPNIKQQYLDEKGFDGKKEVFNEAVEEIRQAKDKNGNYDLSKLNLSLKQHLNAIKEEYNGDSLFKATIIASKMKSIYFKEDIKYLSNEQKILYSKEGDYHKVLSKKPLTRHIETLDKLNQIVDSALNNKDISIEASLIAIHSKANPKEVQEVIDRSSKELSTLSKDELIFSLSKPSTVSYLEGNIGKDVKRTLDAVRIVQTVNEINEKYGNHEASETISEFFDLKLSGKDLLLDQEGENFLKIATNNTDFYFRGECSPDIFNETTAYYLTDMKDVKSKAIKESKIYDGDYINIESACKYIDQATLDIQCQTDDNFNSRFGAMCVAAIIFSELNPNKPIPDSLDLRKATSIDAVAIREKGFELLNQSKEFNQKYSSGKENQPKMIRRFLPAVIKNYRSM